MTDIKTTSKREKSEEMLLLLAGQTRPIKFSIFTPFLCLTLRRGGGGQILNVHLALKN